MSTALAMERIAEASPRLTARAAGFFWLMTFVLGVYALAGDRLVLWNDAAATAANIVVREPEFRLGTAANLLATVSYLVATVLVYDLLKPLNRNLSLLAAFFSLAGCAISGLSFIFRLAPLLVLGDVPYMSVFTAEQLQAQAHTFLRLGGLAFYISSVFFGLHCLLVGYLIVRSRFLPRFVGGLMIFAGVGWLTMSFANLLAPPFGRSLSPYILLPGMLGEGTLSLWLLIVGVNVRRWKERTDAAWQRRSQRPVQP
ncbi:MAG TPA: DUF4386 domain-containing protein [Pyrinomonadaceae bacterium]|nr:DUF4386 domain-containing protein [Pyrinomonadaceae bacterium]